MVAIDFKLLADTCTPGFFYSVTINECNGCARLVVSRSSDSENSNDVYQGVDLTSDECLALGEYLISVSKRINNS